MNTTLELLLARKSMRSFETRPVDEDVRDLILSAGIRAPTAGNQMLYSVIDVRDQAIKDALAVTCDHQPFIARAPVVLVFLADCTRWLDIYHEAGLQPRKPAVGDLFLAFQDAIIAAQSAATAAEALGLGSCYIGDILENAEEHRRLLGLDPWLVPACMLVAGYPSEQAKSRPCPARFARDIIIHRDRYRRLRGEELRTALVARENREDFEFDTWVRAFCTRKYESDFSQEMSRSALLYLADFLPAADPCHDEQQEEWEDRFSHISDIRSRPETDEWLAPWIGDLTRLGQEVRNAGLPILDLGCGSGSDSEYLYTRGFTVTACDYSDSALVLTASRCPGIRTCKIDLRQRLPFPDASAAAVVADLSLHYFDEAATHRIIRELDRVLVPGGLLLVRVNSVRDLLHGAGEGTEIEAHFYQNGHRRKRFFDAADIGRFFLQGRRILSIRETHMYRYEEEKVLWELVAERAEKMLHRPE